jgi:hypothetical protein
LALLGIALGLVGALAGTRVLAVTLAASHVQARRAAHVDPATALRGD